MAIQSQYYFRIALCWCFQNKNVDSGHGSKWLVKITHVRRSSSKKADKETSQNDKRTLKEMWKDFKQLAIPFTDRVGKTHMEDICRA